MGTVWKRGSTWYVLYRYQGKQKMKAIGNIREYIYESAHVNYEAKPKACPE